GDGRMLRFRTGYSAAAACVAPTPSEPLTGLAVRGRRTALPVGKIGAKGSESRPAQSSGGGTMVGRAVPTPFASALLAGGSRLVRGARGSPNSMRRLARTPGPDPSAHL